MNLNPEQQDAVTTTQGPLLILAGAGSGKTKVLTHRIAHILEMGLANADQILAVTFTNKAAGEMKERISHILKGKVYLPWMGTFHSLCVKMLKKDGYKIGIQSNFTIYDTSEQLEIVKQAMDNAGVSIKDFNPRAVLSYISGAKNEFISSEEYASYANSYFEQNVAKFYTNYQKILAANNALDFDDLLVKAVKLLDLPDVLQDYASRFKYIMVDEYQDTNQVQYLWVTKLASINKNLCVVGDDDQSIYAFRGATIKNILNFERDFPSTKVVKLEQNYRSTQVILDAAHAVVSKNKNRTAKKLWTNNVSGEKIQLYTARDEQDEAMWIISQIKNLTNNAGVDAKNVAILYRTNAQSRVIEEWCLKLVVPYKVVGGVKFYDRKEVKDLNAYLKLVHNPQDNQAFERIVNVPRRGIGPKQLEQLTTIATQNNQSLVNALLNNSSLVSKQLQGFADLLHIIKLKQEGMPLPEFVNYILDVTGYIKMLSDGTLENESRIENLKEILSVTTRYVNSDPKEALAEFLNDVALVEADSGNNDEVESITLMTIHSAKGLEFSHVFVVGMEEGIFPHSRAYTDNKELEEERRLAYVAITRAKDNLYLTHTKSRLYFGSRQQNLISRFIEDIPVKLLDQVGKQSLSDWEDDWEPDSTPTADFDFELETGVRVRHDLFGVGVVQQILDTSLIIDFGAIYGKKELAKAFTRLYPA